jgi:hypothetical protein
MSFTCENAILGVHTMSTSLLNTTWRRWHGPLTHTNVIAVCAVCFADHCYIVNGAPLDVLCDDEERPMAVLTHASSGRRMELSGTQPGLQVHHHFASLHSGCCWCKMDETVVAESAFQTRRC